MLTSARTAQWDVAEVAIFGPEGGNPFVDVELSAIFRGPAREIAVGGFYAGDGTYKLRLLAEAQGSWTFTTSSNVPSLDGLSSELEVVAPRRGQHGPVRVDGFHFVHVDGSPHRPIGTTAYAWLHQAEAVQERTLRALASAPFRKLRMCVFPKWFDYNHVEPDRFVFPREGESFDFERFDTAFFDMLEGRLRQLSDLDIQADLILFHPYDKWGFAEMSAEVDARYLRYLVRRLSAFSNVWWSMANEYDLLPSKSIADWEQLAAVVADEDPYGHLMSIHQFRDFYDHGRPWITHCSIQRTESYRTAENTSEWRERWSKPVVIDECGYEGDIPEGWGHVTGEELTRIFWEGTLRGGYVGHGETYLNDSEELWWSKGGALVGSSPARIAFLEEICRDAPGGRLEPIADFHWYSVWAGDVDSFLLGYVGRGQPRALDLDLPVGRTWKLDVIDTWNMTIETVTGEHQGAVRVPLPGRPYMAIRARTIEPS